MSADRVYFGVNIVKNVDQSFCQKLKIMLHAVGMHLEPQWFYSMIYGCRLCEVNFLFSVCLYLYLLLAVLSRIFFEIRYSLSFSFRKKVFFSVNGNVI